MLRTHSATNAPLNRVLSLVLALVALCFVVLLIWNAFHDGRPVGWQMRIINMLGETLFDNVAHIYDRWEQ